MPTVPELFDQAVRCYGGGDLPQAKSLCVQILQGDPRHPGAHHMLGVLALKNGDHVTATRLIREAVALDPTNADCHFNLGIILMGLGKKDEAMASYREAIRINPFHDESHNNLGAALRDQGLLIEAIACFRQAARINPRSPIPFYNLASALKDQGELEEAAQNFRQTLERDPNHADAHNNLGVVLSEQGQPAQGIQSFQQALRINPRHADALNNLGSALAAGGQFAEAADCYRKAIQSNRQLGDAHLNLGNLLVKQGKTAEAIPSFRQALRINPQDAGTYNNLGNALQEQGELTEAMECFGHALRLNPRLPDVHHNFSLALMPLGRLDEAREHNEKALEADPFHTAALWTRTLLRLLEGDLERGWQDYEQRWSLPDKNARSYEQPRWDGSHLEGKTILVYAEQGLGDTVQFVRYLPMVKERGGKVLFECQPALAKLCETVDAAEHVVAVGQALPHFDVRVPLLSLPGIFGTTLATVPAKVPYLQPDAALIERWKDVLAPLEGYKIGIAWRGNPKNRGDRHRSVPLKHFEKLAALKGVRLVSLQVGPGAEELGSVSFPVTDLGSKFDPSSLSDLAAVLPQLDQIVAIESIVAHLAGALAVPIWNLLTVTPDWRWLLEREDSPWYPTMRLFRQKTFGDWGEVLDRVAAEVRSKLSAGE